MRILAALLAATGLSGCELFLERETRPLLTPQDILALQSAGVPSEVIAAAIDVSRVTGPLTVMEIVRLKEHGVDDRLVERLVAASGEEGTVYYHAPYDADDPVSSPHPYRDDPDWVHRQRIYPAK